MYPKFTLHKISTILHYVPTIKLNQKLNQKLKFGKIIISVDRKKKTHANRYLWVSRVLKYPKKCLEDLTTIEKIEFSRWLFEGRLRQGKNELPDGLNWLCYFAGNSKSRRENSISFIFLESPHQVDMKNIVKLSNTFLVISIL